MAVIKRCPVCGRSPKVKTTYDEAFIHVRIECKRLFRRCHAHVHSIGYFFPEERAIEAWNNIKKFQYVCVTSGGHVSVKEMTK